MQNHISYESLVTTLPHAHYRQDKVILPSLANKVLLDLTLSGLLAYLSHCLLELDVSTVSQKTPYYLSPLCLYSLPCAWNLLIKYLHPLISFSSNSSLPFKSIENNVYHILPYRLSKLNILPYLLQIFFKK